jgi:hypothetical protein
MVQIALGGLLSAWEIAQLQHRQDVMDSHASDMNDQRGHYMAVPGQDPLVAQKNADQLIADNIAAAKDFTDANGVMSGAGLDFLGDAMHTGEDMTSPMHTSDDRTPLVWYGAFGKGGTNGMLHYIGENTPADSWARFGQAIRVTLAAWVEANPVAAAKRGITSENFEKEANRRTADYIGKFFSGLNDPIAEDAARQCALGNPAACH